MRLKIFALGISIILADSIGYWIEPKQVAPVKNAETATASCHRPVLFKDSRQALAIARAQGRKDVILLIATVLGETDAVARQSVKLGGDVRFREDNVGYLRVRIPVDHATELAEFAGVEAAAVDFDSDYPFRLQNEEAKKNRELPSEAKCNILSRHKTIPQSSCHRNDDRWPPKLGDYPLHNPYSPIKDLGAAEFRAQHPTWDGRGVTIAVLDMNFDLLLPEFQTAYTVDGCAVPKVADFINVSDPRDDFDLNPQWVDMKRQLTTKRGFITFEGKTYAAPHAGEYRCGIFSERRFNHPCNAGKFEQDIDRDGNPNGDDGLFGVLWDENTMDVWVDTDRDLSFTDEKAMTDSIKRGDVGIFGRDDPKTSIRESIGFTVQTDSKNKFVSINIGAYSHPTMILGAAVGNSIPNGILEGIAPGSRIVSIHYGNSGHGMAEGLIAAFKDPRIDLIVLEQSVEIISIPYTLADARHPISIIAQRLIEKYNKLLFVPGFNLPAFAFVAEDGLASGAISVGGYQSQESYRLNEGFVPEHFDNLHRYALSHGPSTAGALKPDLLAPSGQISTNLGYCKGESIKGLFQLPSGYGIGTGTSTAAPAAAAATALVVSAAKQTGVLFDAVRLKTALTGSARFLSQLAAHEQGNGLLQVGAAFELIKKLQTTRMVKIISRAPVKNKLSHLFVTPDEGFGIYEREGWNVGDRRERMITFTRTSGPNQPMTFTLNWEGNDGTFNSPDSFVLPLNNPVKVPIMIAPQKEGAHSAILLVDHPSVPGHVHCVINTIVVPFRFVAENGYEIKMNVTPPIPGDMSVFVNVPAGVAALTTSVSTSDIRLALISPERDVRWLSGSVSEGGNTCCSFARPTPGVWEINLASQVGQEFNPDASMPIKCTPVTLTAAIMDIGIKPTPDSFVPVIDINYPFSLMLTNRMAKVIAEAESVSLGSALHKCETIVQGEQHVYEIIVPKGATSLRAKISDVSDPGADLDIYLLECSSPERNESDQKSPKEQGKSNKLAMLLDPLGSTRAKADDTDREGEVEIPNPRPGRWMVIVDAFAIPNGRTSYQYLDVFTHPRFGSVALTDVAEKRMPSALWTIKGNVWIADLPETPRRLNARLLVRSSSIVQPIGHNSFSGSGISKWLVPIGSFDFWLNDHEDPHTKKTEQYARWCKLRELQETDLNTIKR